MSLYFSAFDSVVYDEFGNPIKVEGIDVADVTENSPGSWDSYTPLDGSLMQKSLDALLENDKRLNSEIPSTTLKTGEAGKESKTSICSAVNFDSYDKPGYTQLSVETPDGTEWLGFTVPSPQIQDNTDTYVNREFGTLAVNSDGMYWANQLPQYTQFYSVTETLPKTGSAYKNFKADGYTTIIPELKFPGPHGDSELSACDVYGKIEGNFIAGINKPLDKDGKADPFSSGELVLRINETPIQAFYIAQSACNIPININAIIPPNITSGDLNLCYYNRQVYTNEFAQQNYSDNKTNMDFKIKPISNGILVTNFSNK